MITLWAVVPYRRCSVSVKGISLTNFGRHDNAGFSRGSCVSLDFAHYYKFSMCSYWSLLDQRIHTQSFSVKDDYKW